MKKKGRALICHNEVCDFYKALENDKERWEEEFGYDPEDEDSEPPTNEELWNAAYNDMYSNIECEQENLSSKIHTRIVCFGTIERWNGNREIYPERLDCDTLGGIIAFCNERFGGNNETWYLYDDNGDVYVHAYGHDNPTNPHKIEFRMLTDFGNEMWDSIDYSDEYITNEELVERHSEPIGRMIQKVWGYKYEQVEE